MNTRPRCLTGAVVISIGCLLLGTANAAINFVTNTNTDPTIFECNLTATQLDVKIVTTNGAALVTNTVHAMVYKDENNPSWPMGKGIPIPVMNVSSGQTIICHFKNTIPASVIPGGVSIHWHGIELDNDSDGTGVTQDSVQQNQTYEYRFVVPRPGLFWFHSHMLPGDTTFAGMYGVIIIPNDIEGSLISDGVLPTAAYTYPLALSDIEFTTNAFASITGTTTNIIPPGTVGRTSGTQFMTMNGWEMACHGNPGSKGLCATAAMPGAVTLVNGEHPLAAPGAQAPTYIVPQNKLIRLQLMNEALTRDFRVKLLDANGHQINLYHIGGQGGLLDYARPEGGTNGSWNTHYSQGEIVIGSGDRIDILAYTGTGASGAVLRLVGNPLPPPFNLDGPTLNSLTNIPNNYPLAYFQLTAANAGDTPATNDSPILAYVGEFVEQLGTPTNTLENPAKFGLPGTTSPVIKLTPPGNSASDAPSIDDIQNEILDGNMGNGAFLTVPRTNNDRYAYVGDLIQLSVDNTTQQVHPFHLHGFSFQPVSIMDDASSSNLYTFSDDGYYDFLDTINIYAGQTLTFKVRLDDRPKLCDQSPLWPNPNMGPQLLPCNDSACGGAIGRWVYHCHIFAHAGDGMISELNVFPRLTETNTFKFIKHPDLSPTGVDVLSTFGYGSQVVADNFLCTSNGLITQISIWGSWLSDVVGSNVTFQLNLWSDGGNQPGQPLWQEIFAPYTYSNSLWASVSPYELFYDPSQGANPLGTDTQVYRYDFTIPDCDAFYQNSGNIYWLSVTAFTTNGLFGWKTCITNDYFNTDATWSSTTNFPGWSPLIYPNSDPYFGMSMDQSFQIGTAVSTNCPLPVASFYAFPTSGTEPLTVTFNDTSTGNVTNWLWNFGDGNTANVTTNSVMHTYAAGNYSVTLTVISQCGTNTITQTNAVSVGSCMPSAGFYGSPTTGTEPLLVNFFSTSSGTITNWFWNFGDGTTTNVTSPNVSHTYAAGTNTVTLIVSGPCGDATNTLTNYIIVISCIPKANFQAYPTAGVVPLLVYFYDMSSGTITNWFWNFGDGDTTNVMTPYVYYTYTNAGIYSVTLLASGPCGTSTTNAPNYITALTTLQNWQIQYFGSTNNPNGAPGVDLFGTGMNNSNKFLAGFSPTDPSAYLHIIAIVKTNNNVQVIYLGADGDNTWNPGIASRTNVLEFTKGTANGSYSSNNFASTGQTNILSGGSGLGIVTNMIDIGGATNKPSRYYRVRVLVP